MQTTKLCVARLSNVEFNTCSQLPVTRTLYNSNLPLYLKPIFISLQIIFYIIGPSITRTPDNSNFSFYFPWRFKLSGVDCINF